MRVVYGCKKCKELLSLSRFEKKTCPFCGGRMLPLGVSESEWKKLDRHERKTIVKSKFSKSPSYIRKKEKSLDERKGVRLSINDNKKDLKNLALFSSCTCISIVLVFFLVFNINKTEKIYSSNSYSVEQINTTINSATKSNNADNQKDIEEKDIRNTENNYAITATTPVVLGKSDDGAFGSENAENNAVEKDEDEINISQLGHLKISFLNVGQGDAILIECDDHYMIIDGGERKQSDKIYTILKKNGINKVDYVIATHPDSDHIGGLLAVPNAVDCIDECFTPTLTSDTGIFTEFINYYKERNIKLSVPSDYEGFTLGTAQIELYSPLKNSDDNNISIIVRIVFGTKSFLFMGDAEQEEENCLMANGYNLESDVLKVGHHGSKKSTGEHFLNLVNPDYAVISVGKNSYGHPTDEVLDMLHSKGIQVFRTDANAKSKDIICDCDGENLIWNVSPSTAADMSSETNQDTGIGHFYVNEQNEKTQIIDNPENISEAKNHTVTESLPITGTKRYIINKRNGKLHDTFKGYKESHYPDNFYEYDTLEEAENSSYFVDPCGTCFK